MKKGLFFAAMALLAFAVMTSGLGLGSFTAAAAPAAAALAAAADDPQAPPPAPPAGVSPADPKIQPPDMEHQCCGQCCCGHGAMCGGHMGRGEGRFGHPQIAPGAPGMGKGMMNCCGRADKTYRGMMHQRTMRERKMEKDAMCRGMAAHREMAPGRGMGPHRGMPRGEGMAPGRMGVGKGREWGPGGVVAAERMLRHSKDLDLSAEQTKKLEALAVDTQKTLVDLHAEIEKGQLELRSQLQSGNDDLGPIKTQLEAISRARMGIQEARIANLFETKKVLTEKQKKLIVEKFPRLGEILE